MCPMGQYKNTKGKQMIPTSVKAILKTTDDILLGVLICLTITVTKEALNLNLPMTTHTLLTIGLPWLLIFIWVTYTYINNKELISKETK